MPYQMRLLVLIATVLAVASASALALPAQGQDVLLERRVTLEREVVRELNRVRASRGLKPLRQANGLSTAAVSHSRSMVLRGFFAHTSLDGTQFHDRVRRHYTSRGWASWSVGETLLANTGATDARTVVTAWLQSPPHREIVLTPGWRDVGVGVLYRSSAPGTFAGAETLVVTADFGLREGRLLPARASK
jgi:uncharacterized protein YkwD